MTDNLPTVRESATPTLRAGSSVPTIASDIIRPRLPEVGRIRLGERKTAKGGKTYPAKLEAFRFTSRDRDILERVAELWGGEVKPWASDEGPQWQVYSDADSIPVVIPQAELAFSQYFELWAGGGLCERRCDGHTELITGGSCLCDPDERECLPTTRLSVMLEDVSGIGMWRVESHGWSAGGEVLGTIQFAASLGLPLIPGTLSLTQRGPRRIRNRKTGEVQTVRYVVPVLTLGASLRQALQLHQARQARELGLLTMGDRADAERMKALRTAVFTRWPKSVEEPERSVRLAQLSQLLGREVATISNDHDLTAQEAILLTNAVNELPEDTQPALTQGQAAPTSTPADGGTGADPSQFGASLPAWAQQGSAGEAEQRQQGMPSHQGVPLAPAGHHTQGSVGAILHGDVARDAPGASEEATPAEHHTAEAAGRRRVWAEQLMARLSMPEYRETVKHCQAFHHADPMPCEWHVQDTEQRRQDTAGDSGEVAPSDGAAPGGPDRSDTGQPSGPAPAPAAPRRTRRAPKPDLKAEAREATAKRQTIYHGPRNWVQSIADVDTKRDLLKLFGGKISDTHIFVQRFVDQDPDLPSDIAEWTDRDWEPDKLRALLVTAEAEKGGS